MNSDTAIGMPSQHKALGRVVRRQNLKDQAVAYEKSHGLLNRTQSQLASDVLDRLGRDMPVCELLLALFTKALSSSRRSTICDPFPSFFMSTEGPLYEETVRFVSFPGDVSGSPFSPFVSVVFLVTTTLFLFSDDPYAPFTCSPWNPQELQLKRLPSLASLLAKPDLVREMALNHLELLDWIISTERDGFTLRSVAVDEYMARMSGRASKRRQQVHALPTHVFELLYREDIDAIRDFESEKQQFGCIIGYHGSGLENFHSILRLGFDESFARSSSIYGEGIYLSQDLEVARSFLSITEHRATGFTCLGDKLGVMASCEVITHPQDVRHFGSPVPASASPLDDSSAPLPKGYIVSRTSKRVLTRYLLVTSEHTHIAAPRYSARCWPTKTVTQWSLVLFYLALLLAIWYYKGKPSRAADRFAREGSFGR